MDAPPKAVLDRATRLATRLLGVPVSLLSLVDAERQFFAAQQGLGGEAGEARGTPLSHSFCQHVVASGEPLVVTDAREHPLVKDNLAIPDLGVIAYLGVPVTTEDGHVLGSFCAIQSEPRHWSEEDLELLRDIAAGTASEINLRVAKAKLEEAVAEKDVLLREVNHRVANLFALVPAIVSLSARSGGSAKGTAQNIRQRIEALARSHTLTINAFSEDHGVALDALVRAVLEPYARQSEAFLIDGPALRLRSGDGNAMGLALHELSTNAAKYGSLSVPKGSVKIAWRIEPHGRAGDMFALTWTETGGPDAGTPPERQGFGTGLIDQLLEGRGGTIARTWKPRGLSVRITLPFHRA